MPVPSMSSGLPTPSRPRKSPLGWIAFGLVAVLAIGGAAFVDWSDERQQRLARVSGTEGRITLEPDDGGHRALLERGAGLEVYHRVLLAEAPLGLSLDLTCDWVDPTGRVVHQNRYQTRTIDRTPWPTHCRHKIGQAAATGTWTVRMSLDGLVLRSTTFEVR